jgi:hypothetical protein
MGPPVAFRVSQNGSRGDVQFARNFAESNPGYARGLNLFPNFIADLSAHMLWTIVLTLGRLYSSNAPAAMGAHDYGNSTGAPVLRELMPSLVYVARLLPEFSALARRLHRIALEPLLIAIWISIGVPMLRDHAAVHPEHVEAECLVTLAVAASPRLSHIDHDHVVVTDDIQ